MSGGASSSEASSSEAASASEATESEHSQEEDGSENSEHEDSDDDDADPALDDGSPAVAEAEKRARDERLRLDRQAARDARLARAHAQAVPPGAPQAWRACVYIFVPCASGTRSVAAGDWVRFFPPVRVTANFASTRARVLSVRAHSPVRHCLVASAPAASVPHRRVMAASWSTRSRRR